MSRFHKNYLARSIDLININTLGTPIHIIGCGSVGSAVAVQLAKMGFGNMHLYDFDIVEDVNIGCQRHTVDDIGSNKATASKVAVYLASGFGVQTHEQGYTDQPLNGIVISAVDVMAVRKSIFENAPIGTMIIDPRMAATQFDLVTCLKGADDKLYESTLFTDEDSIHTPCTMKSTMFCADILAGMCSFEVFKFTTDKSVDKRIIWDGESNSLTNLYG